MFGDFEDLETGKKFGSTASKPKDDDDESSEGDSDDETPTKKTKSDKPKELTDSEERALNDQKRIEQKKQLKEQFDMEYDEKDGSKDFYDELKSEVDEQSRVKLQISYSYP